MPETPIADKLRRHVLDDAQGRTVRQAVAGARFCAIVLDDGAVGVVNICPDVCAVAPSPPRGWLPEAGTPASEALATLADPDRAAVGLATVNALANRSIRAGGRWDEVREGGDMLDAFELRPDDHVGMAGCFTPLVDRVRSRVAKLSIFEKPPRLGPGMLSAERAVEVLPDCTVALLTATAVMNHTIDALLAAAQGCREIVLLGPSTPLVPEVFADAPRQATVLAGAIVMRSDELLRVVADGGGTREFKSTIAKVNIRIVS